MIENANGAKKEREGEREKKLANGNEKKRFLLRLIACCAQIM